MFSPLEQFEITPLFYLFRFADTLGLPVTNFLIFSAFFTGLLCLFLTFATFKLRLVPSSNQFLLEFIYDFVLGVVRDNAGSRGLRYFPLFFSVFLFILGANLFGLFPYSYTLTSQLIVAASFSFSLFFGFLIIGFSRHKLNLFSLFFPSEAPKALAPLLVPIEIISFLSRPFSLALRLFANMTAGHVLLKILTGIFLTVCSTTFSIAPAAVKTNLFSSLIGYKPTLAFTLGATGFLEYNILPYFFTVLAFFDYSPATPLFDCSLTLWLLTSTDSFCVFFPFPSSFRCWTCGGAVNLLENFSVKTPAEWLPFSQYAISVPISSITFGSYSLAPFVSLLTLCFSIILSAVLVLVPLLLVVFFLFLELFVAVLQAYVFLILSVTYLRDVLDLH